MSFRLAAICLLGLTACTAANQITPTQSIPLDDSFTATAIPWSSSAETVFFYKVRNRLGRVEVCGALHTFGPLPKSVEIEVLRKSYVELGEQIVADNLYFFNRIPDAEMAAIANCAVTGIGWDEDFDGTAPRIGVRGTVFEFG